MKPEQTMTVPTRTGWAPARRARCERQTRQDVHPACWAWEQSGPVLQGRILAAVAAVALVLGVWALTQVDPQQIGGTGLIQVLPPAYFVALGLSLAGFVGSLGLRRLFPALLTGQVVVLIVILQAADPIIHGVPRLEASFRHLGIADYIAGSGQLNPHLDAYFSWPGFFGLLGMLSDATGVHNLTAVATWAPLAINILLLPALLAIAVRLTTNRRHAWAAVWAFYLTSWVGQDYLSPQAYALILLFTLLACVLTAFDGWAWLPGGNRFTATLRKVVHRLDGTEPRPGLERACGGYGVPAGGVRSAAAGHDGIAPAHPLRYDPDTGGAAADRTPPAAVPARPGAGAAGLLAGSGRHALCCRPYEPGFRFLRRPDRHHLGVDQQPADRQRRP